MLNTNLKVVQATTVNKDQKFDTGYEFDPVQDEEAREKLTMAKVMMLFKTPFFGQLSSGLELVNADAWLPTAATDGKRFFYNTKFILALSEEECIFLFGHETLHNVYEHMARWKDFNLQPQLGNIAADYCVNADLIDRNIGKRITTVPILYSQKYVGWTMEEVYDDLMKKMRQQQKQQGKGQGDGQGKGKSQGGAGQPGQSNGRGQPGEGDGDGEFDLDDLLDKVLDEHLGGKDDEEGEGEDGDQQGDGKGDIVEDENGNKRSLSRPQMTEEEVKKVRDEVRQRMLQAYENAQAQGAGDIPAGVQRIIDSLKDPVVNWRELLQQQIKSLLKSDFTFMRASRKSWHTGVILPAMKNDETIDIVISIDLSGSISEEQMRDFISEIKGIMDEYPCFKIKIFTFDTRVYNEMDFTEQNADELLEYPFQGGGGTDFMCCWEYMREHDIYPEKFIMFTDGYPCGSWGEEGYCDTVFIIHSGGWGGHKPVAPEWAVSAYYEDYAEEE